VFPGWVLAGKGGEPDRERGGSMYIGVSLIGLILLVLLLVWLF
jgi:hypothetical protein